MVALPAASFKADGTEMTSRNMPSHFWLACLYYNHVEMQGEIVRNAFSLIKLLALFHRFYYVLDMRDIPEWPHLSCQPNLNHFTNVKWKTRWEGRDGITLHLLPACRYWELDQLFIRRHPNTDLKWTKLFFGPIETRPEAFLGFLEKTTMKAECCNLLSHFW